MAPNPHVRNIRIFAPDVDLGNVDRAKTDRRGLSKKRPKHPGEGLLDEDELDVEIPSKEASSLASSKERIKEAPRRSRAATEVAEPEVLEAGGDLPETPPSDSELSSEPEASERFSAHVVGEEPESIESIAEDFPEPVDI